MTRDSWTLRDQRVTRDPRVPRDPVLKTYGVEDFFTKTESDSTPLSLSVPGHLKVIHVAPGGE